MEKSGQPEHKAGNKTLTNEVPGEGAKGATGRAAIGATAKGGEQTTSRKPVEAEPRTATKKAVSNASETTCISQSQL